jgi:hypothetical protein
VAPATSRAPTLSRPILWSHLLAPCLCTLSHKLLLVRMHLSNGLGIVKPYGGWVGEQPRIAKPRHADPASHWIQSCFLSLYVAPRLISRHLALQSKRAREHEGRSLAYAKPDFAFVRV